MNTTRIVVGVDGSESSLAATRWAATEAQQPGATLSVVHAFDWDYHGARFDGGTLLREWAEDKANTTLADAVAGATAAAPDVTVTQAATLGSAVPVLLD